MDCNLPGSSVHGISQARILEWVVIFFSKRSSRPRVNPFSLHWKADSLQSQPPGKLRSYVHGFKSWPRDLFLLAEPRAQGLTAVCLQNWVKMNPNLWVVLSHCSKGKEFSLYSNKFLAETPYNIKTGFPAQTVKNPSAMRNTWVQSLDWEDPLEKGMAAHSSSCLENCHGQGSLVGYSPWGRKESDTTEHNNIKTDFITREKQTEV